MKTFGDEKKKEPSKTGREELADPQRRLAVAAGASGGENPLESFLAMQAGDPQDSGLDQHAEDIIQHWLAILQEFDTKKQNSSLFDDMELDPAWLQMKDIRLQDAAAPRAAVSDSQSVLSVPTEVFDQVRDLQLAIGFLAQGATGAWIGTLEKRTRHTVGGRIAATIQTVGHALAAAMTALCDSANLQRVDAEALRGQEENAELAVLAGDVLDLLSLDDLVRLVDAGGNAEADSLFTAARSHKALRAALSPVLGKQLLTAAEADPEMKQNLTVLTRLRIKAYYTSCYATLGQSLDSLQHARDKSARLREAISTNIKPGLDDRVMKLVKKGDPEGVIRRAKLKELGAPLFKALQQCEITLDAAANSIILARANALKTLARLTGEKMTDSSVTNYTRKKVAGLRHAVSAAGSYLGQGDPLTALLFQPDDRNSVLPAAGKSELTTLMMPLDHAADQVELSTSTLQGEAEKLGRVLRRESHALPDADRLLREGLLKQSLSTLKGPALAGRVFGTVLEGALNRDGGGVRLDEKVKEATESVTELTDNVIRLLPHLIQQLGEALFQRAGEMHEKFAGDTHATAFINQAGRMAKNFREAMVTFLQVTESVRKKPFTPRSAEHLARAAGKITLRAGQVHDDILLQTPRHFGAKYRYTSHERKLVQALMTLALGLAGGDPDRERAMVFHLQSILNDPARTVLHRKKDPHNILLTTAMEQAYQDHRNDISLRAPPTAQELAAQIPGMMDAIHGKAVTKTLQAVVNMALGGVMGADLVADLASSATNAIDPTGRPMRPGNVLKGGQGHSIYKTMEKLGKSAVPGKRPPDYEYNQALNKQAVQVGLMMTTVIPSPFMLPVTLPLAAHAALTKPDLFVKKAAGTLPLDVAISGGYQGVRVAGRGARAIGKILQKRRMDRLLRAWQERAGEGEAPTAEELQEVLDILEEAQEQAKGRMKRNADGSNIESSGSTASGTDKRDQWQEELEEHKSNVVLTTELLNSSVTAKRQEVNVWIKNNQLYQSAQSLLRDLYKDNALTEQLVNAYKGGGVPDSDDYLNVFEKIIHDKAGSERVKAIFETFRNGLIKRIPVNDMLHFTESERFEALKCRYPNEESENILFAMISSSENNWPQSIKENESLRDEIRILKSATQEQKEASQARWDEYWLLGMKSHIKPKDIENTLVDERLEQTNLTQVEGKKVTADTPVTLTIKASSWLIDYLEKQDEMYSSGSPKRQFGNHTIQTTVGDWTSGRWINVYMQKLNLLYTLSEPISHHKPEILDATIGNTKLTSEQVNLMSASVDEGKQKVMALLLFANKETRDVIRRERMREMRGSLIRGQEQIDKSKMTDAEAEQVKSKIQRLLAGEKEPHGTFTITSREGQLPVRGLIWFKTEGLVHLFSRQTGQHLIISEADLNSLNNKTLSPDHNVELVSFILKHADPKQAKDVMVFVGNDLHKFRQDFNSRYASSVSKYASADFKYALWNECVEKNGKAFDGIKADLKEKYAQHQDKNIIYAQIDSLMTGPKAFDKVLKLYRAIYPEKDYELKLTIQTNEKTGTLDDTMNEFLLWEVTSASREFDMNTTTESEESRRQWEETAWFAASMAAAVATGGATATAGAALKLSSTAIWCLTVLAQAGVEGAQQWLRASTHINEEERAAAMSGIPVAMLMSLGIDVALDRVIIPLGKKAFKGIKAGVNNVEISAVIKDISSLRTEALNLRSTKWSQHTGRSRTNQVVETILESDRVKELLKTKSRQEIREQIERSVEAFRARHAAQELTFSDEVAVGFKSLTPLTNAGTVTDFGLMDTYAKVNHLQNYAMETPVGKELAQELGPDGEQILRQLSVKHLTNDFYGSPRKNNVWASETLEKRKIDILLDTELSKLRNIKKGLDILAQSGDVTAPAVQAGKDTDNKQIAIWAAGGTANSKFGSYIEIVDKYYHSELSDFTTLQNINARLTMVDNQLSTHVSYDPQYHHTDVGAVAFRQWLSTVDADNPRFYELLYQAILLYRPFKEGNIETARMVYGISKIQKGEFFSIYEQVASTPQQVVIRFDENSQPPESLSYSSKKNKLSQDATGIIYEHESGLMKDYIPENGLTGSNPEVLLKKAQRDVEFLKKIHGENNVKLYHYYVNGQERVSVWIGSYYHFTVEGMIRKNIDRGASDPFIDSAGRMDFEKSIDDLVEELKQKGILVSKIDMKDIMYNHGDKKAALMNFDNAIMIDETNTLTSRQVKPMRDAFNEMKVKTDTFAERLRFEKLNDHRSFVASYQDRKLVRNKYKMTIASYAPAEGDSLLATKQNNRYREFMAGVNEYNKDPVGSMEKLVASKKIPKNYKSLTDVELISATQFNILESSNLTDREIGMLSKIINDKIKKYTIKDADKYHGYWFKKYNYGSSGAHKLNQFTMLTAIERPIDGRCRPLTMAMASAIENNREKAFSARIKGISDNIMAAKGSKQSELILQGQRYESALRKAHIMKFSSTEIHSASIESLINILDNATTTSYFQINTKQHSMLAVVKIVGGKKQFLFYDPNYGLFEFSSIKDMEKSLNRTLGDVEFARAIGAEIVNGKTQYDFVKMENITELGNQKIEGVAPDVTISDLSLDNVTDRLNHQVEPVTNQPRIVSQPVEASSSSSGVEDDLGVYKRDVNVLEYKAFKMRQHYKAVSHGDRQKEFRVVPLDETKSASKSRALKYSVSRESVIDAQRKFAEDYKKINKVISSKLSPEQKKLLDDAGITHNLEMGERISHLFTPASPEAEIYLSGKKIDRRVYVLIAKEEPGKVLEPKIYGLMATEVEPNAKGVPVFSVQEVVADPASQLMLIKKVSPEIYKIIVDNVYPGQDMASSSVSGVARQMSEYAVKDYNFQSNFKISIDAQNARTAHMAQHTKFKKAGEKDL